jgi:hypothetical protein
MSEPVQRPADNPEHATITTESITSMQQSPPNQYRRRHTMQNRPSIRGKIKIKAAIDRRPCEIMRDQKSRDAMANAFAVRTYAKK